MAVIGLLAACGGAPAAKPLGGAGIAASLQASGLPVSDVVVHTAESDPNKLLGRPNQYTIKVNWTDTRVTQGDSDATIEVFADEAGMKQRAAYVEAIGKNAPMFVQYIYTSAKHTAVLRVPRALTPDQAKEYEEWLSKLS